MYLFPVWPQSMRLLLLVLLVCLVDLEQVTNPSLLGLSPQALTCDRALCFPISSSLGDDILSVTLQIVAHSSSALGWTAQLDLSAPAPPLQDWGQGAMLSSLSYTGECWHSQGNGLIVTRNGYTSGSHSEIYAVPSWPEKGPKPRRGALPRQKLREEVCKTPLGSKPMSWVLRDSGGES